MFCSCSKKNKVFTVNFGRRDLHLSGTLQPDDYHLQYTCVSFKEIFPLIVDCKAVIVETQAQRNKGLAAHEIYTVAAGSDQVSNGMLRRRMRPARFSVAIVGITEGHVDGAFRSAVQARAEPEAGATI